MFPVVGSHARDDQQRAAGQEEVIVAIIAAVLGFGFIAGTAAWIAKVCFIVFLILTIVTFPKKSK